ncbi:MAG: exodeoxyribonuclease VII large subunit [Terriglobia bacterium]
MGQSTFHFEVRRKVYAVSELTREIRNLLEPRFLDVWVTGEVSNCCAASSGHIYFTLKDQAAQLRVVCFRNQARYLKFKPKDGISLIARGRLAVYDARGEYQLLAEFLEPAGLGALQLAFEQLKAKLAAEGLFDSARKKPLPMLPRRIGLVTSPTGAVIRDILRVLRRRFRNMDVVLFPARVQGEGAAEEIIRGIRHFNACPLADVVIVARGGGSLEDLWAFNEERVARAIVASSVPIISAVGHETDFTIADFVADLRAPTPSAAAEMVVHRKEDLEMDLRNRERRMRQVVQLKLSDSRGRLAELALHRAFQTIAARLGERAQRLDDLVAQMERRLGLRLNQARETWLRISAGVLRLDGRRIIGLKHARFDEARGRIETTAARKLMLLRSRLDQLSAVLRERNPELILSRGYSITRDSEGNIIRDASAVPLASAISIRLAAGELDATVRDKRP